VSLPLTGLGLGVVIPLWESWPSTSQRLLALEGLRVLSAAASKYCPSASLFPMVVLGSWGKYRHQFLKLNQIPENENC